MKGSLSGQGSDSLRLSFPIGEIDRITRVLDGSDDGVCGLKPKSRGIGKAQFRDKPALCTHREECGTQKGELWLNPKRL